MNNSTVAVELFCTKDLGLATSLLADSIKYVGVERDSENSRRLIFQFEAHPDISRIQTERANGTHIVSSTHYEECMRKLKSIIHSV